jgi:hypothetical protein
VVDIVDRVEQRSIVVTITSRLAGSEEGVEVGSGKRLAVMKTYRCHIACLRRAFVLGPMRNETRISDNEATDCQHAPVLVVMRYIFEQMNTRMSSTRSSVAYTRWWQCSASSRARLYPPTAETVKRDTEDQSVCSTWVGEE